MKRLIFAGMLVLITTAAHAQAYTTLGPAGAGGYRSGTQRDNYSTTGNVAGSGGYGMQRDVYHKLYGRHRLPAEDAIRFGYGNAYPTYHSGWGGLYRDGNYPGSVDDNMGPPYWGPW
jgi:hypothetical protein